MRAIVAFLVTPIVVLWTSVGAAQAPPEPKLPPPAPTPTPGPDSPRAAPAPRLRLDLDRHLDAVVKRHDDGKLRFEDRIEVTDRAQERLEALLRGVELACSASAGGPPQTSELNAYRTVPIPPYADFIAAARALVKALKRINPWKGEPRFVLYALHRGDDLRFLLREGELSLALRLAVPGTNWDEIARFHDRGDATTALRRLERGFETLARRRPGEPPHPSTPVYCLPQSSR